MQISEQNIKQFMTLLPYLYNALFNYSLPDAIKEQNILKVDGFYGWAKILSAMVGEQMGIDSYVNLTRKIDKFIDSVEIPEPHDPEVMITREIFNGVPVVIHTPTKYCNKPRPGLVFLHGGGFVLRSPEKYFPQTVHLAKTLGAVVVSVDYRLSPEYIFPVPLHDCLEATYYLMENAKRYFVNPDRIGIIGDSAGGNMAASISLIMRDKKQRMPKVQVLIYPAVQILNFNLPSSQQNDNMPGLSKEAGGYFLAAYMGLNASFIPVFQSNRHICEDDKTSMYEAYINLNAIPKKYLKNYKPEEKKNCDPFVAKAMKKLISNPRLWPLMAKSLSNLPPALILNAEYDIVRDDGLIYGNRLKEEGVDVEEHIIKGGFHGMFDVLNRMKIGNEVMEIIVKYLKKRL